LYYYKLRKNHQLATLSKQINLNENKLKFILKVVENEKFLKQDDESIIDILNHEKFLKVDETFNYLLNIPIRGCTLNAVKVLNDTISNLKQQLSDLDKMTINQLWINELDAIKPYL
jgi:DNA topoisomerase-2